MICESRQHNEALRGATPLRRVNVELALGAPLFENHSSLREALRAFSIRQVTRTREAFQTAGCDSTEGAAKRSTRRKPGGREWARSVLNPSTSFNLQVPGITTSLAQVSRAVDTVRAESTSQRDDKTSGTDHGLAEPKGTVHCTLAGQAPAEAGAPCASLKICPCPYPCLCPSRLCHHRSHTLGPSLLLG